MNWERFLLWNLLFNYGLLLFWAVMILTTRKCVFRWHRKFFDLTDEQFNLIHYAGITFYKILIFAFCLFPYLALRIINS